MKDHLFCYKFIIQILIKHNSKDLIGPIISTNGITVAERPFLVKLLGIWNSILPVWIDKIASLHRYRPIYWKWTQNLKTLFRKIGCPNFGLVTKSPILHFLSDKKFFSLFFVIWERRNVRIEKKWRSGSHLTPERQYRSSKNVWATQIPWAHLPTFS